MKSNRIQIIQRPPFDQFTYELFHELVGQITVPFEAYYTWTNPPAEFMEFVLNNKFEQPVVVLAIKDMLDMWHEYNYWQDHQTAGVALLDDLATRYPDKKFVVFTSLEHLDKEITQPNIFTVPWGGDVTNQASLYSDLAPVFDKNFDSTTTFISLNRNARDHRVVLLSYLFGLGLDQVGYISFLQQETQAPTEFLDRVSWQFEPQHDTAKQAMIAGFKKFYTNTELKRDDYIIYPEQDNNNVKNFENNLRSHYQNSFVEFVTESSFSAPSYMITEKTLNSVFACNFPIFLCGQGMVAHLRELGFDVFDDIVNHDYDHVANPLDRLLMAVDHNQHLLTDPEHVKQAWKQCVPRFKKNLAVARNMCEWYAKRGKNKFDQLDWN